MRNRRAAPSAAPERTIRSGSSLATAAVLAAGLVAVSCWVSVHAYDQWRASKELAFRGEAILLLLVGIFAATAPRFDWRERARDVSREEWIVCGAILAWTGLTTLISTNRSLSEDSLVTVAASIIIYLATRLLAPRLTLAALGFCFLPAIANAVVGILQETKIWNPWNFNEEQQSHVATTGLLGNPNFLGTYLAAPAVAAIVAAIVLRGRSRWVYGAAGIVLAAGVFASGTRTSVVAFAAGLAAFGLIRPWRQAAVVAAVLIAGTVIALNPYTRLGKSFIRLVGAAQHRRYAELSSERLVPALTAIEMTKAHPIAGVGPGNFKYHYMDERLALHGKYPEEMLKSFPENFGETHNDHLQVMSETGLPGYAIYLAAIAVLVLPEVRRRPLTEPVADRQRVARLLRIPFAATFFVICLAQFPLQLASARLMYMTLAALINGWDDA